MENILKVIDSITNDRQVKSIINSVNNNQEQSKNWLIDKSKEYFDFFDNPKICVAAGWYGHLANKLINYTNEKVLSFDKDPNTKFIGSKLYNDVWFKVVSIEDFDKFKNFDIVICTSCEHLEKKVINDMIKKCKQGALIILQSNNYFDIDEHINCHKDITEFENSLNLKKVLYKDTLQLNKFDRYMVIGTN
ncbi:MAG: hypothetical protein CMD43_02815 [Gammaproteobacteria bacterium]|nr:hypothetical protein [Gammaproteobacteria bacterium]|tara:strand:- start:784 stop:1356 length:573 start_codon:yes stop_codon:yes gene_type:complete